MEMQGRFAGNVVAPGYLREEMNLDEEAELKCGYLCLSLSTLAFVGIEVVAQRYKDNFA